VQDTIFIYDGLKIYGFLVRNLNKLLMNPTFVHILVESFTLIVLRGLILELRLGEKYIYWKLIFFIRI
jgi:hypothetical protein